MPNIKYFLYTRKSSESEDRQVQSIEDQNLALNKLATQLKLEIIGVYEEAKSAKKPNNRPMFTEMLERIQAGEASGILCWQINRLTRNPVDGGALQWMLQQNLIQSIQTIDKQYLPGDNALLFSVESGVANQFILDLSKNTKRGMQGRVDKGWMPNMAPLGYMNAKDEEGRGIILPDPERFDAIRKMWDMMLTGSIPPQKIVAIANNEWGFVTRKMKRLGGKPMSDSTIYRTFNNRFYTGMISHRKEWHKGSHVPMITQDEFEYVQKLLGKRGVIRKQKREFAFTGFLRCAECGCLYTAETHTKFVKKTKSIQTYSYYHCTRKRKDMRCTQGKCIVDVSLTEKFEKAVASTTILPEFREWALEAIDAVDQKGGEKGSTAFETLNKTLTVLQTQLSNLTGMRMRDLIDDAQFVTQRDQIKGEIEKVQQEISKTDTRQDRWIELKKDLFDFTTYAHHHFVTGGIQKQKIIAMALGSNQTFLGENLNIDLHPWLIPIVKDYPAIEEEYLRLEPSLFGEDKRKNDQFAPVVSSWLRGRGSNPRPED